MGSEKNRLWVQNCIHSFHSGSDSGREWVLKRTGCGYRIDIHSSLAADCFSIQNSRSEVMTLRSNVCDVITAIILSTVIIMERTEK